MDQVTVLAQEGNQLTDILSFVLLLSCGNIGFIEIKCIFTARYQDICLRTGFAGDATFLWIQKALFC
ncbi:MAG: hypothetical protein LBU57_00240 [Dysgonamonadaceae bacterium]|nr:hypothetical protein [Dysgonamonadaceae bacterium]